MPSAEFGETAESDLNPDHPQSGSGQSDRKDSPYGGREDLPLRKEYPFAGNYDKIVLKSIWGERNMQRILVLEDDYALAMGIEYALQAEGYEVLHASTLQKAREMLGKADREPPSLLLLDICLPDGMGMELCREVRQAGSSVPIIFLTALSEEVNIVQGLEMGADDYVAKPFRLKELLSRIRANIRRYEMSGDKNSTQAKPCICFGAYRFLPDEYRLFRGEEQIECTMSELRLLKELVKNAGNVLSRDQLLLGLFDTETTFVEDNTLSVYMKRLRTKLGEEADRIETVRGIGYRFRL